MKNRLGWFFGTELNHYWIKQWTFLIFLLFACVQNFYKHARQPISRVLSFKLVIYLGLSSHLTSSNQPWWLTKNCFRSKKATLPSLFGLAPGGVFHAFSVTKKPVRSYRTFSPLPWSGGSFSVALSLRFPSPDVIWHRVLIEPGLSSLVFQQKRPINCLAIGLLMKKNL